MSIVSRSLCALGLTFFAACSEDKPSAFSAAPDAADGVAGGSGGRVVAAQGQGGSRGTAEGGAGGLGAGGRVGTGGLGVGGVGAGGAAGGSNGGGVGAGGAPGNFGNDAGPRDMGRPDVAGDGQDSGPKVDAGVSDANAMAQLPPMGKQALQTWLAAGHYKIWKCEAAVMSGRANGHGRNRICSNALASAHGAGPYPVGAASVKELYSGATINGYAVSRKIKDGPEANTWYWYENGTEGVGIAGCADCHSKAKDRQGNDYVYIQVK